MAPSGYKLSKEYVVLTLFGENDPVQVTKYDENGNVIEESNWAYDKEITLN